MRFRLLFIPVLVAAAAMTSCSSKKTIAAGSGEVVVEQYCSGPDYFTNKEFFRANAIGESMDQMLARKKAMANAREQMAADISTTVKSVVDNYYSSKDVNNVEEAKNRFEGISRQVVNQKLQGIRTICEKFTKTKEGTYKCYIAIELSGADVLAGLKEKLSTDDVTRLDFEYEKFKGELEKEMQNAK